MLVGYCEGGFGIAYFDGVEEGVLHGGFVFRLYNAPGFTVYKFSVFIMMFVRCAH